jgi:hypothetical protein
MYVSHQGLQAMHQERVNTVLARAERRQLLRQACEARAGRRNRLGAWRALLPAVCSVATRLTGKPAYGPSFRVE